jgi:GAF domain-containing protein
MPDPSRRSGTTADLCDPFLTSLPVSGAAVSVSDRSGLPVGIAASDDVAARIDELQFDLGEGPQWDCVRTGRPVLVPDLRDDAGMLWPLFLAGVAALPVRALFTLPLMMGAVTVGAVTLHRSVPGALSEQQQSDAITIAAAIAGIAVDQALRSALREDDDGTRLSPGLRREAHQATGMILVQLDTTATDAFARLRAYAFATGSTVQAVAVEVLERRLDFTDLPD